MQDDKKNINNTDKNNKKTEYLNSSKNCFQMYLQTAKNPGDKEEIKNKIESLNNQIKKNQHSS